MDASQKGQNQGPVNALIKMKAVGRIQIPGTLGYDVSFIRLIPTPSTFPAERLDTELHPVFVQREVRPGRVCKRRHRAAAGDDDVSNAVAGGVVVCAGSD